MSQTGTPTEPQEHEPQQEVISRNVELDISVDQLWQLVSDPDGLTEWLGEAVDIDVQPGGAGTITDDGVLKFVHVDRVDAGRRLSFSWWEPDQPQHTAHVVFEVAPAEGGRSRLSITETLRATAVTSAGASRLDRQLHWEARVCALWACTVVAALIA